jgi:hypothetical protein
MFLISGEDDSSNLLSSNYSRIPGLETNSELIVGGISSPVANPLLTATVEPTVPTVDFVSASSLDQARDVGFSKMKQILQIFAADPEFADKIEQVFGDNLDPEKLQSLKQDWLTGELIEFPENEIVSQPEIAGGNGAFDQKNAKIYFAQEFLEANTKNPDVIADVGLEEYGHFIDSLLNSSDTPGDEGEHFAAVVQGKTLTPTELAAIQAEDDTATVVIDGQTLVIEKAANTVSLTTPDANAAEVLSGQTANPGRFTVTRTGITTNALTVNYTVGGTATKGTDYSNLTGSVTIPIGATTANIPITVIDDTSIEGSETSVVTLSTSTAYDLGTAKTGTVTIADNEVAAIAAINMGVNQTLSGSLSTTDPSNPTRTGGYYKDDYRLTGVTVGQPVKVNLNSSAFDAYLQIINESTGAVVTYNDDTNGTNNSELTFTPQSGVNYLVRVTSYGSGSTGAYSLSTTSTSPTNVSITASDSSAAETISGQTANPGQFTITRTGSTSNALTVNYTVAGTATKGTDYSNLTGSLTIPAGSTTATLPVNVIDDSAVEGSETSVVSLSSSSAYTLGSTSSATVTITDNDAGDWFTQNIQDPGLQSIARSRASDNVLDRNDMIAILGDAKDGSVIDANELTNLRTLVNNASRFNMPDSVRVLSNKIVNSDPANQSYQGSSLGNLFAGSSGTQMDNLINKWFLGLDHPSNPYTYQYATGSLFVNGATYQDINQGYVGDCYYLASLAATALRSPSTIQNMFIDNGDNTYTVRFYNSGVTDYVTVDRYLPTSSGTPIYAKTPNGELWVALAEKAYAQVNQSGWIDQDGTNSYSGIEGGLGYYAIPHITGRITSYVYDPSGIVNTNAIINAFNTGKIITVGSKPSVVASNVVPGHAYTLVGYNSSTQQFTLYNPWGMNGGYDNNGTFKPGQLQLTASQLSQSFDYWDYTTDNGLPQYGSSTTLPPELYQPENLVKDE